MRADPDWRPDLSVPKVQTSLPPRAAAYYNIIEYCRHIGLHVPRVGQSFWIARVRNKLGGYKHQRLAQAWSGDQQITDYETAVKLAQDWFESKQISQIASASYPVGSKTSLSICPIGEVYTVGHALAAYIEWKRISARRSHFLTVISLINYYLVPRVSHIVLEDFNGRHFHDLAVTVLETLPKKRSGAFPGRVAIASLSEEALRKRRKTFNSLVSVLRGTFDLSWEQGYLKSDRPIRCLRRLPNVDRPRIVYLDRSECTRLIDACSDDLRALVKGVLYTGCRISELKTMRVGDYSAQHKSVLVRTAKGTKTRYVMLPVEACEFFQNLTSHKSKSDLVFVRDNSRRWGNEYKHHFRIAREAAGLGQEVTMHGLRHTYASQLVEAGASLMAVADQLGHADTQTVSATYGHLAASTRANEIDRCFAPLYSSDEIAKATTIEVLQDQRQSILDAHERRLPAWPRSNYSKAGKDLIFSTTRNRGGPWR